MIDQLNTPVTGPVASVQTNSSYTDSSITIQPDFKRLSSALSALNPDCDEFTWKFNRIAPLANAAIQFPELTESLYGLAMAWSRGDLQDKPSKSWVTPGANGKSGKDIFDSVWDRFYKSSYTGKRVTLGTIYFHAKEAGWTPPDDPFEIILEQEV